jgi:glucose/arabinose dehydrogenase
VNYGGERGLLGIAVDPQFPTRPYFYTHMTATNSKIRIQRWTVTGDLAGTGNGALTADPASRYDLLALLPDNASNHNGGTVRFGTDGMLYVSLGDDATGCPAQEVDSLKGKILRLDVSHLPPGPGTAFYAQITPADNPFIARPDSGGRLVYAYGLRNPFRFQVDAVRKCLVVGDVGLDTFEEMDLLGMTGSSGSDIAPAGSNFGWPWREGFATYNTCGPVEPPSVPPVYAFDRTALAGAALISAGVYHGRQGGTANWATKYEGDLFFGEYSSGTLRRLKYVSGTWDIAAPDSGQADPGVWASGLENVSDWRVGPDGSLYACRQFLPGFFRNKGTIEKIVYTKTASVDTGGTSSYALRLSSYPSPARNSVTLTYTPANGPGGTIRIYDVRGRVLRELAAPGGLQVTRNGVLWDGLDTDGRKVPNGIYWARIQAAGKRASCSVVLAR